MRSYFMRVIPYTTLGGLLSYSGVLYSTWQFWGIMGLVVLIDVISAVDALWK